MRIKFTYQNGEVTERDGELLAVSTGSTALTQWGLYFLVKEDGSEHPKHFRRDRMSSIQTYADRNPVAEALESARAAFSEAVARFAELETVVLAARGAK